MSTRFIHCGKAFAKKFGQKAEGSKAARSIRSGASKFVLYHKTYDACEGSGLDTEPLITAPHQKLNPQPHKRNSASEGMRGVALPGLKLTETLFKKCLSSEVGALVGTNECIKIFIFYYLNFLTPTDNPKPRSPFPAPVLAL